MKPNTEATHNNVSPRGWAFPRTNWRVLREPVDRKKKRCSVQTGTSDEPAYGICQARERKCARAELAFCVHNPHVRR